MISKWRTYHLLFREYLLQRTDLKKKELVLEYSYCVWTEVDLVIVVHSRCSRVTRIDMQEDYNVHQEHHEQEEEENFQGGVAVASQSSLDQFRSILIKNFRVLFQQRKVVWPRRLPLQRRSAPEHRNYF